MNTLRDKLLALVDKTASQANEIIGGFNTMIDDIDWDSHFNAASEFMRERKETLTAKANDLLKEFSELVKQVKDNLTDFSITVPFDASIGEELSYAIEDNVITVEVSFNDDTTTRTNKTTVKVPQNCDVTKVTKTINKIAKTATITIPKILVETPKDEEEKPKVAPKKARATKKKVAAPKEETVDAEEQKVSSKLAQKLKQNFEKAKLQRDASGRFVRREA